MVNHICYDVKDYDSWHEFFEKQGMQLSFEAEVNDEQFGYRRCFYVEDPETGMVIEIKNTENPTAASKQT